MASVLSSEKLIVARPGTGKTGETVRHIVAIMSQSDEAAAAIEETLCRERRDLQIFRFDEARRAPRPTLPPVASPLIHMAERMASLWRAYEQARSARGLHARIMRDRVHMLNARMDAIIATALDTASCGEADKQAKGVITYYALQRYQAAELAEDTAGDEIKLALSLAADHYLDEYPGTRVRIKPLAK